MTKYNAIYRIFWHSIAKYKILRNLYNPFITYFPQVCFIAPSFSVSLPQHFQSPTTHWITSHQPHTERPLCQWSDYYMICIFLIWDLFGGILNKAINLPIALICKVLNTSPRPEIFNPATPIISPWGLYPSVDCLFMSKSVNANSNTNLVPYYTINSKTISNMYW